MATWFSLNKRDGRKSDEPFLAHELKDRGAFPGLPPPPSPQTSMDAAVRQLHPHRPGQHPGAWRSYRAEGAWVPQVMVEKGCLSSSGLYRPLPCYTKYQKASILFEPLYFGASLLQQLRPWPTYGTE